VLAIARRVPQLASLRADQPGIGDRLIAFRADVTDRIRIAAIVHEVERTMGPIELAIASAGIAEEQTAPDLNLAGLERALTTNVCGVFNVLVPVAAAMRRRGHGHVVAISSLAATQSLPRMPAYCASKAALNSAMAGLHLLLRGSGVCVTTICPGFIATEMTDGRVPSNRCMPLDRAVTKIAGAIHRRRRICRFPVWQHLALFLLGFIPGAVSQALLLAAWNILFPKRSTAP
jgi:short-subunit dehydrogenase